MAKKLTKKQEYSFTILKSYEKTFSDLDGQRVLFDLMNECGLLSSSQFTGDPYETAFREGKRYALLYILKKLETDPQKLRELIEKKQGEERNVYS